MTKNEIFSTQLQRFFARCPHHRQLRMAFFLVKKIPVDESKKRIGLLFKLLSLTCVVDAWKFPQHRIPLPDYLVSLSSVPLHPGGLEDS